LVLTSSISFPPKRGCWGKIGGTEAEEGLFNNGPFKDDDCDDCDGCCDNAFGGSSGGRLTLLELLLDGVGGNDGVANGL